MHSVATLGRWHPLVLLIAVTSLTRLVTATNNIPCTFADEEKKQYYDLRPLIKDTAGGHNRKYYLNVCNEIHYDKTGLSDPWGVAAFQSTGDNKGFSIGRVNKTLVLRDDYLVLTYRNGDECGERPINAIEEAMMATTTDEDDGHKRRTNKSGGSSFFSILSILVSIYLLIGILYKRFMLNARGFEQVPNIDTWRNIIDWCKDMFYIILAKIYPSYGRNRNYSSLRSNYRRSNSGSSGRGGGGGGIILGGNNRHQHGFADDDDDDDAVDVLITEEIIEEEIGGDGQVLKTVTSTSQTTRRADNISPSHSHSSSGRHERTSTTRRGASEEGAICLVDTGDEEEA
ncbi:hypothetical protein BDF22DRAFT_776796 [Syncephalis plumigaleata]|nr:hypothetical protein BDF22DRAFT_776796 [Syncephalis plumigaleata]